MTYTTIEKQYIEKQYINNVLFLPSYDVNGASFMVTIYITLKISFRHTSHSFSCASHWKKGMRNKGEQRSPNLF